MQRRIMIIGTALLGVVPLASTSVRAAAETVANRFAQTLNEHDLNAFAALFDDDYVNHQLSAAARPQGGVAPKVASVAFFGARLKALPDLTVTIEAMVAQDDRVAASFVYEGTHQAAYFGIAPTGRRLRFTSCDIFRVADGRIVEHWGMGDIAGILAQLKG
ncbi:ester cyclase [Gluconacetobacter sp. Hr-1-5]|uniref:ester cyclase n=1 Tax=Gluconacetobacter sp. Hr-1-5 TaxID=3395370 RepID=UPI003B51C017